MKADGTQNENKPLLDSRRVALIVIAFAFGAAVWWDAQEPAELPTVSTDNAVERVASLEHTPRKLDPHAGAISLIPNESVRIESKALRVGEMVVLDLGIPRSEEKVENLDVVVLAPDGRGIRSQAVVDARQPQAARVQVQAGWLKEPGRYVVSVKVPERSHFPHRRYAILVE